MTMRSLGKFFANMSRLERKLAHDETGSPAVEFALVFPIFIAIVLATLQAGTIFLAKAFFESWGGRGGKSRSHQSNRVVDCGAVSYRNLQSADCAV